MLLVGEPTEHTVKVPGPVKICVLKLPTVVIAFPPVATIKDCPCVANSFSYTDRHPTVESI